ncbi:QacE family quaternary ammonium compound efflux SMR transporter [Gracilibacillus salitolerans]|uniref:QacE family quaternary ammonium compound efflux SMR transporter n=1 Tax=Gracilibacillus salitolerans TaxID=2663022 RepID=A0A5Q2TP20_9BACI|nr:multidrug efflux SMR transporter [Gracilibacillus salitolerans]QGH35852.1 QacE family quaternary ammonium compound efflux SMR transporter [Gracilibacillus salitolerans]
MAWIILIIAGLFEMLAVLMMNQWHRQKSKLSFSLMIASFALSFLFLSIALESIPMSMGYAIWTGIGAAGGAIIGIIFYNESKNAKRIFFLSLIILAVIGLKLLG